MTVEEEPIEFDVRRLVADLDAALERSKQAEQLAGAAQQEVASASERASQAIGLAEKALAGVELNEGYVTKIIDLLTAAPGGPWDYARIGAERTEELLTELGEWVAWLEGRYLAHLSSEAYTLPGCWFEHPVAVELLTALMVSHRATYTVSLQLPSDALLRWHTHCFEPCWSFLSQSKVFMRCLSRGGHEEAMAPRPPRHSAAKYAAFVERAVAARADAVAAAAEEGPA